MLYHDLIIDENQSTNLLNDLLKDNSKLGIKENTINLLENNQIKSEIDIQNRENVSDLDLINRRNGWLNSDLNRNSSNSDTVLVRCTCFVCCGEPTPQDSDIAVLSFILDAPAPSNSLSQGIINTLLSGYYWSSNTTTITYSFYEDSVFNGSYYGSETGVKEVSEAVKSNVREILEHVETFLDLDFVEVQETNTSTFGQLRYMLSNNPSYAYAYLPYSGNIGSDVHLRASYDHATNTNGFQNAPGKHGYTTLIHETFHALGLTHPQDGTVLDPLLDNLSTTVMTYDFRGNSSPATAMPYDIAALQYLFGAANHNVGNTTYVFSSRIDTFTVNSVFPVLSNNYFKQTIWDSSGNDTLDFSNLSFQTNGYLFDLNEGGWLVPNDQDLTDTKTGERYYNYGVSLAYDMTIENVINSISDDTIYANTAANTFSGYAKGTSVGDDTLFNTDELDTLDLSSYAASDITQTKSGNDLLIDLGSDGSVTVKDYYGVSAAERINISLASTFTGIAIAEFGKITNLNHNQQTIQLQNDYVNPVVFAQPLSYKGSDTSIVRITDIDATNDTISLRVQEAEYRDGKHTNESFSYMVVEAGTWQLEDGTLLEVGTVDTWKLASQGWENINFSNDFVNTPVILSQVQTNKGTQFVKTRQKNATANGFSLTMEEEEALKNSGHAKETLGWFAMSGGSGTWDGFQYQAGNTGKTVNHNWHELDFSNFSDTPNLMATIGSYYGADPSGLRYRETANTNDSNIEIKVEEDQSFDSETWHVTEEINFLAIEGSGILTAEAYNPVGGFLPEDNVLAIESDVI